MKTFEMFFETQWPRLMEIQSTFMNAHIKASNYHDFWMAKRIERQKRLDDHAEKLHLHRCWMLEKEFGEGIQWLTTWVPRSGNLKLMPAGSGWRNEILQYVYWFEDDKE